ncbi:hypothetical protein NQ314_011078 [Rhamnusium bicolor]|uniref:Uncharacterized protein n=1 Tax=Rhamnusium bicolor TaxID=1586634 RepID=A0AAV8XLG7_9CUCU|nr:hypothetical protein NQ314_011078 [Rhamnusium bicolor]
MQFPCNLNVTTRSKDIPKMAHQVRPGGQGTWKTSLTLPNIIKMFNPNLIGYSLRTSLSTERESQFNVAEGGAISSNMPYMAKILVKRIKMDPRVNLEKDWKMITHMVGDNDFCSEMCYYKEPEAILAKHKQDLLDVLRILKTNLPRTIVNVIPPPQGKGNCFFDLMQKWQELDIEISNSPEFDLDDFTVIAHYFTLDYTFPTTTQGRIDYSYLSEDCFHFSEKGHSRFANDLWNSIMEPFGNKSTDGSDIFSKFLCPTEKQPFIFTRRNTPTS